MKPALVMCAALAVAVVLPSASKAESAINLISTTQSKSQAGSYSGVSIVNQSSSRMKTTGNAVAPGLIASGLSCAGSVSVGAGWMGGAFSIGLTTMDKDCNRRENAKIVGLTGDVPAAKEVMCNIKEVRDAYARVGRYCIGDNVRVSNGRRTTRTAQITNYAESSMTFVHPGR